MARTMALLALVAAAGCAARDDAVVIRVTAVPPGTPPEATLHLAGTFNGWSPGSPDWALTRRADGSYEIALPREARGTAEFKLTLGSWDRVETDAGGRDIPNRRWDIPAAGPAAYNAAVAGWRDGAPRASTTTASVSILSDAFEMPRLGRTRTVRLYLPPDYEDSDRRYPVLYMHDGQNAFDDATSYAGEWGIDETLDSLFLAGDPGVIVVAIDHAGEGRVPEYSPSQEGAAYVEFLVRTLKPYVDARYRTRAGPESTGVAGSSMGGLISLYAALTYPDVFGLAGVFSPALWIDPTPFTVARRFDPEAPRPRVYMVTGAREGTDPGRYVQDHERMAETLVRAGFVPGRDLVETIREDGTHSEWFWRREFPAAYLWLFRD